ncbi:MAG: flagellar basal body protein [Rhodovarius sp.]|nr:flagellar basal body protein [Rhodovarius sp.]
MALDLALHIARSGLLASQKALAQASHNIANADTAGYTRKRLDAAAEEIGGHPLGIRTGQALRDVDLALLAERDARAAAAAAAALRERFLTPIEAVHGRPEDAQSLPALVGALRQAFIALRAAPADAGLLDAARSAADRLAARFRETAGAIQEARRQAQAEIVQEVAQINDLLRGVAETTRAIRAERAAGRSAADLEDDRDRLLARLSESLPLRPLRQADGGIVLLARHGLVLPLPDGAEDVLSTAPAETGPTAYHGPGGSLPGVMLGPIDITRQIAGGRLGELIGLRDATLPRMLAELDVAAVELAGRMEAVGLRLFTDGSGAVPDRSLSYLAGGHAGFSLVIQIDPAAPADARWLRDGTHATAGGPGLPTPFTPNPPGGPAGFVTLIDRVLDHALGEEAAPGQPWAPFPTSGLGPDGSLVSSIAGARSIEEFATQAVRLQAEARAEATLQRESAARLRDGLEGRIRAQSGVDPDAEMTLLLRLQNAYAANARVMSTAQAMWDALLAAVR